MRRIALKDHETHTLYVEDINEEILEDQYGGMNSCILMITIALKTTLGIIL